MRDHRKIDLPKILEGAHQQDVSDQQVLADVRQLIVVETMVGEVSERRKVIRFFDFDGKLVGLSDPRMQRDWSK
tara:strand:- start:39655 stop:39876 length:222 start_codon:yes stop_codon:yes gene_type:complete